MDKILVVDDEADIRRAFHRNLASDTLQVVDAANGDEAIRMVAKERPTLVLMDIRMGATSGLDTLRKLRELDPKLFIIMMTAYGTTQTALITGIHFLDIILEPP